MHHSPRASCHERNRVDSLFLRAIFSCHSFSYIASFFSQAKLVPFVTLRYPFFYSPAASYAPSASLSPPSLSTHSLPVPNLQESIGSRRLSFPRDLHAGAVAVFSPPPLRQSSSSQLSSSYPAEQLQDDPRSETIPLERASVLPPKILSTEHDRRDATNVESCTATLYPRECTETRSQSGPEIPTQTSASKFVLCKAASSSAIASGFTSSASILIADEL